MAAVVAYTDVRAGTLSGAGGGSSGSTGHLASDFEPQPHSAFSQPFAGWLALSDIIAESNPELGDTMRALAAVLRAGIE